MTEDIDLPDLETLGRLAPRQLSIANVPYTRLVDPKIYDRSQIFAVGG